MNKLIFRQGYADCITQYLKYNLSHCENMVDEMRSEGFNPDYIKGFVQAWADSKHRFILHEGDLKEWLQWSNILRLC